MSLEIGQKVYVYEHWSDSIQRGTIKKLSTEYVSININAIVDKNGDFITHSYGSTNRPCDNVFTTALDCHIWIEKKNEEAYQGYCSEINTVEDLVKFPLEHCLDGEEYTDSNAVRAYKDRVKELLNIEL